MSSPGADFAAAQLPPSPSKGQHRDQSTPARDGSHIGRWTPTGAICINEPRHPELVGRWKRPDCNGDGKRDSFPACGQSDNRYSGKGLLVNRFNDDQSRCGK